MPCWRRQACSSHSPPFLWAACRVQPGTMQSPGIGASGDQLDQVVVGVPRKRGGWCYCRTFWIRGVATTTIVIAAGSLHRRRADRARAADPHSRHRGDGADLRPSLALDEPPDLRSTTCCCTYRLEPHHPLKRHRVLLTFLDGRQAFSLTGITRGVDSIA